MYKRVKITTFVPPTNADDVRRALGAAGAGVIGEYTYCSYSVKGIGRFKPSTNANPHIGTPGEFEEVAEERIEVVCDRHKAQAVIEALSRVHPYEEVAFDIVPLLELSEL